VKLQLSGEVEFEDMVVAGRIAWVEAWHPRVLPGGTERDEKPIENLVKQQTSNHWNETQVRQE
jgi:hypothetical protein